MDRNNLHCFDYDYYIDSYTDYTVDDVIPSRLKGLNPTRDNILEFDLDTVEDLKFYKLIDNELYEFYMFTIKGRSIKSAKK